METHKTKTEVMDNKYTYPFKKMHSREFQGLDLTNLVSYFNSFIDEQNGLNNSNDNNLNLFSGIISNS